MMETLYYLIASLRSLFRNRRELALENLALRQQLAILARTRCSASTTLMAMAYFYPDDAHEEQITFPDGSTSIIFSPTTGLTLTSKSEARSKMVPAKASEQINVTMDVNIETDSAGRVGVKGICNLPLDTALMISLKNTGSNYLAQDKASVLNDGSFASCLHRLPGQRNTLGF